MKKINTLLLSSTLVAFSTAASATCYTCQNEEYPYPTPTTNQQDQTQKQGQGQIQGQQQSSNSNSNSNSNANSNSHAQSVSGAQSISGAHVSGVSAQGGNSNSSSNTGPVTTTTTVAPSQSTVNEFRSFVGTNAPALSASVDNCLAVTGTSFALNIFGGTGVGIGGGSQQATYVAQCAAVKSAFDVWNRASGDKQMETFAIEMLIKALPAYAQPAMEKAVERVNTYIEQNGAEEPESVMQVFGAKSFNKKAAPAVTTLQPVPAAPTEVKVNLDIIHQEKKTAAPVKKTVKKAVKKTTPCNCTNK